METKEKDKLTTRFFNDIDISVEDYDKYKKKTREGGKFKLYSLLVSIILSALILLIYYTITDTSILSKTISIGSWPIVVAMCIYPAWTALYSLMTLLNVPVIDEIVRDYFANSTNIIDIKSRIEMEYMVAVSMGDKGKDTTKTLQLLSERILLGETDNKEVKLALFSVKYSIHQVVLAITKNFITAFAVSFVCIWCTDYPQIKSNISILSSIILVVGCYAITIAIVFGLEILFKAIASELGSRVKLAPSYGYSSTIEVDVIKGITDIMKIELPIHYSLLVKDTIPSLSSIATDDNMVAKKKELDVLYKEYMSRYVGGNE